MKKAIGVMATTPLPGMCKPRLLAAHSPQWVAGLYAAMLRDSLDGLQSVDADDYVVFVAPGEGAEETKLALEVLRRHVPAPWQLVLQEGAGVGERAMHALGTMFTRGADYALLSVSDAPSFPPEPLTEGLAAAAEAGEVLVGPSDDGGYYVLGMAKLEPRLLEDIPWSTPAVMETTRLRCREAGLTLRELPAWYDVDEPSDVIRLVEELRKQPELAPRTAQFLVTNA